MSASGRIGLLGGMFDPIHCGHLDLGAAAQRALGLTEVHVIPANLPPHREQPCASSHHRFAMVAMAVAGRGGWRADDMELREPGPSYTSGTLRRFQADGWRPADLFFIAGADAFLDIATWHDYPAVLDLAHFAVVARAGVRADEVPAKLPGLEARMITLADSVNTAGGSPVFSARAHTLIFLIEAKTADVSSTAIRRARLAHRSIAGLVPSSVQQHIEQHGLYEDPRPAAGGPADTGTAPASRLHGQD